MESNDILTITLVDKMENTLLPLVLETPFKRPSKKKRRAIATPPTFFIPRSRPPISPLTFNPSKLKGNIISNV